MNNRTLTNWILSGVATAASVAVVVLSILGEASTESMVTLLGIGLFALSLWSLQKNRAETE
jgi:hypothetical protein